MIRVEQTVLNALDATIGAWKRQEKYSGSVIKGAGDNAWPICKKRSCDDCPLGPEAGICLGTDPDAPMVRYQAEGGKELARESWQWFLAIRKQCTAQRPISEEIGIALGMNR